MHGVKYTVWLQNCSGNYWICELCPDPRGRSSEGKGTVKRPEGQAEPVPRVHPGCGCGSPSGLLLAHHSCSLWTGLPHQPTSLKLSSSGPTTKRRIVQLVQQRGEQRDILWTYWIKMLVLPQTKMFSSWADSKHLWDHENTFADVNHCQITGKKNIVCISPLRFTQRSLWSV